MAWQGTWGFQYTTISVLANAPKQSGVYVIYSLCGNIYVGESGDIRTRLLQHLKEDNGCITRCGATLFAYELVPEQSRVARQDVLILELQPACNQKLGEPYSINFSAASVKVDVEAVHTHDSKEASPSNGDPCLADSCADSCLIFSIPNETRNS
jgi:hypothetical protein